MIEPLDVFQEVSFIQERGINMALVKVSEGFKEKFKNWFFIIVCVLIYSWTAVSCVEMWLNCAILDVNAQNVSQDVSSGNLTEVSTIDSSGNFYIEGNSDEYTSDDISEYIRVPNDVKYYYNLETRSFVSKLTMVESRNLILKFFILDIVCTVMLIMSVVHAFKGNKLIKIASILLYVITVLFFQFAYEYAFEVLFNITSYMWVIMLTKGIALVGTFVVKALVTKYTSKNPKRLRKHR